MSYPPLYPHELFEHSILGGAVPVRSEYITIIITIIIRIIIRAIYIYNYSHGGYDTVIIPLEHRLNCTSK